MTTDSTTPDTTGGLYEPSDSLPTTGEPAPIPTEPVAPAPGRYSVTERHMSLVEKFPTITEMLDDYEAVTAERDKLADRYENAQKLIGRKVKDWSEENHAEYAQHLDTHKDIPADASGYDNPGWKFADSTEDDADGKKAFQDLCKGLGQTRAQANGLYEYFSNLNAANQEYTKARAEQYVQDNQEELKRNWGNQYDNKMRSADHYIDNIMPKITGLSATEGREYLRATGALGNALMMKQFAVWGEVGGGSASNGHNNGGLSPYDASVRLQQIGSDPDIRDALINPMNPRHKTVKAEWEMLHKMKHGEA